MPDSRLVTIHKRLQTVLGADFSAGYSGIDMTGRVVRGSVVEPPYTPFGCVYFVDSLENYGPTLGRFRSDATFEVYTFIGGGDASERADNALNIASDGVEAITANRQLSLGSLVDDVLCSYTALDGDKFGLSGIGIGYIRVSIKFQSDKGV